MAQRLGCDLRMDASDSSMVAKAIRRSCNRTPRAPALSAARFRARESSEMAGSIPVRLRECSAVELWLSSSSRTIVRPSARRTSGAPRLSPSVPHPHRLQSRVRRSSRVAPSCVQIFDRVFSRSPASFGPTPRCGWCIRTAPLAFGNGGLAASPNTLFFAAGLNDEADWLFGTTTSAPPPPARVPNDPTGSLPGVP